MAAQPGDRRLNVAVIFGGRSGEHEVSLASARSVVANLDPEKYQVHLMGITKEGRWLIPGESERALTDGLANVPSERAMISADHRSNHLLRITDSGVEQAGAIDVVFPVLHGPCGEDGTVQGLLELAGLPYVGAGVLGSAVGMDKVVMKTLFEAAGLRTPKALHFKRRDWVADGEAIVAQVRDTIGFPCFVKPANLGSSVGITKVRTLPDLVGAVNLAAEYDVKVLVERSVEDAHEIECSVLGNDEPEASVIGEVIPSREFYSYEAKYVDGDSELIIPAQLPQDVTQRIRQIAVTAFESVDCAGLARVDFLVTRGSHEIYVSEINTLPGFTEISMYPKLWEASGLAYGPLLDRLIELALERHAERGSLRTTYG